jgi:hypothetical protein
VRTDGRMDRGKTKLIVAFRNFASAPKNERTTGKLRLKSEYMKNVLCVVHLHAVRTDGRHGIIARTFV